MQLCVHDPFIEVQIRTSCTGHGESEWSVLSKSIVLPLQVRVHFSDSSKTSRKQRDALCSV